MNQSVKIDPYGFREYDARWLYEKDINKNGITVLGKGLGTQIIKHTKKNNPRVIDIDIIDFRGEIKKTSELILPHPRCHLRNFVLFPILQIDPNWFHPILKKNVQYLINNLSQKSRIEITRLQKNVNIES